MSRSKKTFAVILSITVMLAFIPTFSFAASSLAMPVLKVASTSATTVTLSWEKIKTAKGYYIYCKAPGKTSYKKIKTIKNGTTVKWVNKSLKTGKKYVYKIKAYKGTQTSKASKAVSAIPRAAETSMATDIKAMANSVNPKYAYNIANVLAYDSDFMDEEHGWRTAGSAAEHRASKYLAEEMKAIGLTDVERAPVDIDKWQFNDAYLTLKNKAAGVNIKVDQIVSYASSYKGTVDEEIVYMNHGYVSDYEAYYDEMGLTGKDRNMNGKIVLCDINQYAEYWITPHYIEAYEQGAGGIITYSSQYVNENGEQTGTKWDDACQMQDICSRDFEIPCMSISRKDGLKLISGIKKIKEAGLEQNVCLYVDNQVIEDGGTSYNVVGKIKGTGNTGQQIIVAGHYDKYWWGFQDDCAAIAVVLGIAKSLIDSDYKPVNDIVFVAHGAEEWGRCGAEADWAIGSWDMITDAHPEWSGKTLAIFNYELPTTKGSTDGLTVSVNSVEEIGNTTYKFNESDLLGLLGNEISKDVIEVEHHAQPMSDAISYQLNGVPCIQINTTYGKAADIDKMFSTYHTKYDDKGTYDATAMYYNIAYSAGYLIQTDKLPAQEFDLSMRLDNMKKGLEGNEDFYDAEDLDAYKAAMDKLQIANDKYAGKIKALNNRYVKAIKSGADKATLKAIRAEGKAMNAKSLKMYQYLQDEFVGFIGTSVYTFNEALQESIGLLDDVIAGFDADGNITDMDAVLGNAWKLNGMVDYTAYNFSKEVCIEAMNCTSGKYEKDTWTYGRQPAAVFVSDMTYNIFNGIDNGDGTYKEELNKYKSERERLEASLDEYVKSETNAMNTLANSLK